MKQLLLISIGVLFIGCATHSMEKATPEMNMDSKPTVQTYPVKPIPNLPIAAEAYYSMDGEWLICNAQVAEDDSVHHTYVARIDGSEVIRTNNIGEDACSFFFPDGKRIIYTSIKDNLHLPKGKWSDPTDYPIGAELYISDMDGSNEFRLTNNEVYDAEVSVSPDGEWVLFSRQKEGEVDLWKIRPDGSEEQQITFTRGWQEGGAFYLPDSETILYRAWERKDEGQRGMPMTIFTIKHDGSDLTQITFDKGTNWAPHPGPDGKHFVFVKVLPPHNFEIFLMNMDTGEQTQLTHNKAFDGFPVLSPDGQSMMFSSSRDAKPGERTLSLYIMDISSIME